MQQALKTLKKAEMDLKKMADQTQEALDAAPEGVLRISCCGEKIKYFRRYPGCSKKQVYISKNNMNLVRELAQKSYNKKLLKLLNEKLRHIKRFLDHYPEEDIDSVYNKLSQKNKELVTPLIPTTDQYAASWINNPYEGLGFRDDDNSVYFTEKGERVRSKSEVIIADALFRMQIPYKYECPLRLNTKIIYPDFTLLDIKARSNVYFEHFGMMDDEEYAARALQKINMYARFGIIPGKGLIFTMESSQQPLDTRYLKTLLTSYFYVY